MHQYFAKLLVFVEGSAGSAPHLRHERMFLCHVSLNLLYVMASVL